MLFACKDDAERVLEVLGKRLGKYGLQLHPDKTQLVDFRCRPDHVGANSGLAKIFNFLGFTHVWGMSRRGKIVVRQKTAKDRFARTLKAINEQCRYMRHWPLQEQHQRLCRMLKGHFAFFGISGNYERLDKLSHAARLCWRKWLSRRSRGHPMRWDTFNRILDAFPLPQPKIVHRYACP